MNWTGFLPAWLSPALLGGIAIAGVAAFATHELDQIPYARLQASSTKALADLQGRYVGFRLGVANNTAAANAKALKEATDLQATINALQGQLAETQKKARERSDALQKLLASAKPGDIRPLGPIASEYYRRLRQPEAGTAPAGNP